ncbi:MAG: ImmA/IrrE family metallo-endopeptidase [Pyrinomonadaceae bacterium]
MNNFFTLPPTEKRKQFELRALALRDFAGVRSDEALDPFALAEFARLLVVDFDQIKDLSAESREHLLGDGMNDWSGGACSRPLPNGWRIVILNPAHGIQRNRATLMEEISHVFLGHKANRLAVVVDGTDESKESERKNKKELAAQTVSPHPNPLPKAEGTESGRKILTRDYNKSDEEEAYAVGAAALVPYAALRRLVLAGRSAEEIARRFRVSRPLAEYRIKVTHLWAAYKGASAATTQHV